MTEGDTSSTRSWLFTSATRPDRFENPAGPSADVVMIEIENAVTSSEKDINRSNTAGTPGHSGAVVAGAREAAPVTSAAVHGGGRQNPGRVLHDSPDHLVRQSLRGAAEIDSATSENKSHQALRPAWSRMLQAGPRVDPDTVSRVKQTFIRRGNSVAKQNLPGPAATSRIQEKKMSKIHKMAAVAAMAVSVATLLMMAEPAAAAPHRTAANYCLSYGEGGTDCSFTSKAQCEATASGLMAERYRNVYGKEGETLQW